MDWNRNDQLGETFAGIQALLPSSTNDSAILCRELSQQITQMIGDPLGEQLTVFISTPKSIPRPKTLTGYATSLAASEPELAILISRSSSTSPTYSLAPTSRRSSIAALLPVVS